MLIVSAESMKDCILGILIFWFHRKDLVTLIY